MELAVLLLSRKPPVAFADDAATGGDLVCLPVWKSVSKALAEDHPLGDSVFVLFIACIGSSLNGMNFFSYGITKNFLA